MIVSKFRCPPSALIRTVQPCRVERIVRGCWNYHTKVGQADVKIQSLIGKAEMPIFAIIFGGYVRLETLYSHMTFARFAQGLVALHR